MSDIQLDDIKSGYNLSKINGNFQKIEDANNNTVLHRSGGNNAMSQEIDMNGNAIYNLPKAEGDSSPITLGQLREVLDGQENLITGSVTVEDYSELKTYTTHDEWVTEGGVVYRPDSSLLPIGPEVFDESKWIIAQITGADELPLDIQSVNTNVQDYLESISTQVNLQSIRDLPSSILQSLMLTGQHTKSKYFIDTYGGGEYIVKTATQAAVDGDVIDGEELYGNYVGVNHYCTDNSYVLIFNYGESLDITQAGARHDGVMNCTEAMNKAAKYIESRSGGVLTGVAGEYLCGRQTLTGVTGTDYSYQDHEMIDIRDCDHVKLDFDRVKFKIVEGLRYGSFDPITGDAYFPSSFPFYDTDYRAVVGNIIDVRNNNLCEISGVEIDGGCASIILGGRYGDKGYQIDSDGIFIEGNEFFSMKNVYVHHNCRDGLYIRYRDITDDSEFKPHIIENVTSEYNGRQALSLTGCNQFTAINCNFDYTGMSIVASAPGAGVDVEAERSIVRNAVFINCGMKHNIGPGFLAVSGDNANMILDKCLLIGSADFSGWFDMPSITVRDTIIVGSYTNPYGTDPEHATVFDNCIFTDEEKYSSTVVRNSLSQSNAQSNVKYNGCKFIATRSKIGRLDGATLNNCIFNYSAGVNDPDDETWGANYDDTLQTIESGDWICLLWGSDIKNLKVTDSILDQSPSDPFYIGFSNTKYSGLNYLESPYNWLSWVSSTSNFQGYLGSSFSDNPLLSVSISASRGRQILPSYSVCSIYYAPTIPPTGGDFSVGDMIFDSTPTAGQSNCAVCTVSGTAGSTAEFKLTASIGV